MAVITQKQIVLPVPRGARFIDEFPASGSRVRTRASDSDRAFTMFAWGAAALAVVGYIAGYAAMTSVNFQRIRLQKQLRNAQAEHQIIHSTLVERSRESLVREWAAAHGMVAASGAPVFVGRDSKEGR